MSMMLTEIFVTLVVCWTTRGRGRSVGPVAKCLCCSPTIQPEGGRDCYCLLYCFAIVLSPLATHAG